MCESQSSDPEVDREVDLDSPTRAWTVSPETVQEELRRLRAELSRRDAERDRNGSRRKRDHRETSDPLEIAQLQIEIALELDPEDRNKRQRNLVRHWKLEQKAIQFPFVANLPTQKLRVRRWGLALGKEGDEKNPGISIPIPRSNTFERDQVWVVPLDIKKYRRLDDERFTAVECSWKIIQRNGSGQPKWLFFSLSRNRRLSFGALELRLQTGNDREILMLDIDSVVGKVKKRARRGQAPLLPITLLPAGNSMAVDKTSWRTIGEYLIRARKWKDRPNDRHVWEVTINTFCPFLPPEIPIDEILNSRWHRVSGPD